MPWRWFSNFDMPFSLSGSFPNEKSHLVMLLTSFVLFDDFYRLLMPIEAGAARRLP